MSHELEIKDGAASFVFNKQYGDPWHRLGTAVDGNLSIDDALRECRGDYTVAMKPLFVEDSDGNPVEVEKDRATYREIDGSGKVLGIVGDKYTIVQNRTVLEKAYAVVGADENDAYLDTAGVLFDGRRFFAYLRLEDLVVDPEGINDKIERGLAIYSSHDGSIAVTYAFTDVRAVCNNTITFGIQKANRVFRAKHTNSVDDRIDEAQSILGVSTVWADSFAKEAEKLLGVKHTTGRFERVLDKVFPVSASATDRQKNNNEDIRIAVRSTFDNERNAQAVGKNGWSMYNSIVEYVDHGREANENDRLHATLDPRDKSWANERKLRAQSAVLALA